jgi:flagellar hook-associated protein 1 FlgK
MSDILSIAASGLRAYQSALTTTSENIANAGTAGYVRRKAEVREVASPGVDGSAQGLGVALAGISRVQDTLRTAAVRTSASDLARTESGIAWLERIENALGGAQLGSRLGEFFNAARAVAADPSAVAPRAAMLESASTVATGFAATGSALASAAADLDATAEASIGELNALGTALSKINAGLSRAPQGSASAAALADERDRLLERMSGITDVSVNLDAFGRAQVRAGAGGPVLVEGDQAGTVTYVRSGGTVSFAVHRAGNTAAMSPGGGVLAGIGEGAERIQNARDNLDAMAEEFADGVNTVQASGRDLAGDPGEPIFEAGDPPSQMTLVLSDPRGIAAAGVGRGPRDNSNLAALDALRTGGGFEARLTDTIASNGAALNARKLVGDAQGAMHDSAVAARDSVSAVNLDEEAVDLLRYQQAYQASSRVIQIARDTLNSILEIR